MQHVLYFPYCVYLTTRSSRYRWKRPALRRGDRPVGHDDQRDDRSAALKRQLDMVIRLRLQPIALVKGLCGGR